MEEKLTSRTINAQMLTKEQEKLFWAERTIEKFKAYDKQRTEYVHDLEQNYHILRKRYDELEAELNEVEGALSKGARTRNRKIREYNSIMRGERALQVMQDKYMIAGEYTPEFRVFLQDYNAAIMKEEVESLRNKIKKLKRENEDLLYQLIKSRERIRELE